MNTPLKSLFAGKQSKDTEYRTIIKTLLVEKQPLTRRRISEITKLELPTLCRALYNLTYKLKLLKIASIKPCITTGKLVYHYYFIDNSGGLGYE